MTKWEWEWLESKIAHAHKFLEGHPDDPHDDATEASLGLIAVGKILKNLHAYLEDQTRLACIGQTDRYGLDCQAVNSGRESAFRDVSAAISDAIKPPF